MKPGKAVSYIKRQIRAKSLDEWNRRYRSGETAAVTKIFFPDAVAAYKTVKKLKPVGVLTQVLTGHGGFAHYLNRFRCRNSPSCVCDPDEDETIAHLLFDYPSNSASRLNIEYTLGTNINAENASKILKNKYKREAFLKYCEEIAQKAIRRNK